MKWCASLLLTGLVLTLAVPDSSAQLFGSKKPKVPPQQRVPELVGTLKYDKDARKRADAAEELRQFELKDFPEIIPVLVEALQNDQASNVRVEAATSLGRLRPISAPAGMALEKAASGDANLLVRLQAKTSLLYYQLSGYHTPKNSDTQSKDVKVRTDEPPLANPGSAGAEQTHKSNAAPAKSPIVYPAVPPAVSRPLPSGPTAIPQGQVPAVSPPLQGLGTPPTVPPPTLPLPPPGPIVPPALQNPPTQWGPVQSEGPVLMPPK